MNPDAFNELLWQKGTELFRPMPWRENTSPYYVMVSEIMLQQTQVDRVRPKFLAFMDRFPTIEDLAAAGQDEVVAAWSGLGYNRRARYLHQATKRIVGDHAGRFPDGYDALVKLPGIGPNTAGAILAYSFNQAAIFIETNIRTVFFHHLIEHDDQVDDRELRVLVEKHIDQEHPREWYWALMDYGSYLKRSGVKRNVQSRHYVRQSPLKGSLREVRGLILKRLAAGPTRLAVLSVLMPDDDRFAAALQGLTDDGLVTRQGDELRLAT